MINVIFLSHVASKLVEQFVTFYPERAPGGLGEARMGERGRWEIVLDPDIIAGRVPDRPFLESFLHEVAHIKLGHVLPRHITDADRAAARVKYAADMPAILARAAEHEAAADAWAAAVAPVVDAWCQREYGMPFDAAARLAEF